MLTSIVTSLVDRRRSLLPVIVATLASLALFVATSTAVAEPGRDHELPTARELIERYVEAVGGFEAIDSLKSRVANVSLETDLQWDTHIHELATLSVYGLSSGEYLVVTETEDGAIIEGFDGVEDWKIDPNGAILSENARGLRDAWLTDPQFPLKLERMYPAMRSSGIEQWGEDTVYVVDIDGDESHRLGFDVETGLLTRLGYNRELRDYEEVDGVMVPRRVAYSRKGGSTTYVVDSLVHNASLDRTIFSLAK